MIKRTLASLLALASTASADSLESRTGLFHDKPGLSLELGGGVGVNTDQMSTTDDDFGDKHPMTSLLLGYRLHTGTQPFVTAAVGFGGRGVMYPSVGAGVRQGFQLGRFEPFIDAGVYQVSDEAPFMPAFGVGAGVETHLNDRFYLGASANHFFGGDNDDMAGLDWSGRLYVGTRLGAGYR
jgi:hypothetical protein